MRNFLCIALALSLSGSVATNTAEACGGYGSSNFVEVQTFAVSSHWIPTKDGNADGTRRAFVLLGSQAPDGTKWQQLAPMTYDATRIAPAPGGASLTLTLVGAKGTRVVQSSRYVYLSQTFVVRGSSLAVEFDLQDGEDFEVALVGKHPRIGWSELANKAAKSTDHAWLRARGIAAHDSSQASLHVADKRTDVLSLYDSQARQLVSIVRKDGFDYGRYEGYAIGTLAMSGTKFVVIRDEANVRLVRV